MTSHEHRDRLEAFFGRDRLGRTLGIQLHRWGGGWAELAATPTEEHANFVDIVHGGYLFSAADVALGVASNSWGRQCVAISIDIQYLRAAHVGVTLAIRAEEVNRTRSIGNYRVEVSAPDRLVATATAIAFRTNEWHFGADAWSDDWRTSH
ncbi:MAG: PaaI family thioesterase [Actinomycetota bacterium]